MAAKKKETTTEEFEKAILEQDKSKYIFSLYVTGMTPNSTKAIANIRRLCEEHLTDRYELEVIDIYQRPEIARGEQIIAAPTLIKKLPLPLRKLIGDMSNTEKFLVGLDIQRRK